ncbi:uncharacterized protein LOC122065051 [Macadamia integrifolia]|uniref:uncharacterized protein LOC122065051 n=1 Tax=Macadamia integrifolia TaxID=60698 RepID=UPI001C4E9E16|nr:uncharacterized protein LOC122065051 [Macadamia integrifolia]
MFQNQIGRNMEVYVDDMLVKSNKGTDHVLDLKEAFGVLRKNQMRLNPTKCAFGVTSGKFLGFLVSQRGIEANPSKIEAIHEMRAPRNIREVQKLAGCLAALSRFLSQAGDRCLPFFKLLKGGKGQQQFRWIEECEAAFEEIKACLARPPLLSRPEPGEELQLYLATSAVAVSAVLVREEAKTQRPIYYVSHVLLEAETRYRKIEKHTLALVVTSRKLRPYFQAHAIAILIDQPLRKSLHSPSVAERMVSWVVKLSEHNIEFRPRSAMKGQALANFLVECTQAEEAGDPEAEPNRKWVLFVDGSSTTARSGAGLVLKSPEEFTIHYALRFAFPTTNNEAEYEALIAGIKLAKAVMTDDLVAHSDSQLIVNQVNGQYEAKEERMAMYLKEVRRLVSSFGTFAMVQIPRQENALADALSKIATADFADCASFVYFEVLDQPSYEQELLCSITQRAEPSWMDPIVVYLRDGHLPGDQAEARAVKRRAAKYTLHGGVLYKRAISWPLLKCLPPSRAEETLREVHEGICGGHIGGRALAYKVLRQGFYWPNMQRDAMKFVQQCFKCQAVEKFVRDDVIFRYGVPKVLVTDNGRQFDNRKFRHFCSNFNIDFRNTAIAHPQSNGQAEKANHTLIDGIEKRLDWEKKNWADQLLSVLWAYRTSARTPTGETPFRLTYETEALTPVEVTQASFRSAVFEASQNEAGLQVNADFIDEVREEALIRNETYKQKVQQYHNKRVKPRGFVVGDLVLRKAAAADPRSEGKLSANWEGPYIVSKVGFYLAVI